MIDPGAAARWGGPPIFLLGMMGRTGTNFLHHLLTLHPDVVATPISEDFLLARAAPLFDYAHRLTEEWRRKWGTEISADAVCRRLGDALLDVIAAPLRESAGARSAGAGSRLLTKTPSVQNLEGFFQLFPEAKLLILIRDGRAVVESGTRTVGWSFDDAARWWAEAAVLVRRLQAREPSGRYHLVRYEDLFTDTRRVLRAALDYLELDAARFPFAQLETVPVLGSSQLLERGEARVHWDPVPRFEGFDPLRRWARWDRARHERFNWIAGDAMRALGYGVESRPENRLRWTLWNRVRDVRGRLAAGRSARPPWALRRLRSVAAMVRRGGSRADVLKRSGSDAAGPNARAESRPAGARRTP